jgi:hypothetical protein
MKITCQQYQSYYNNLCDKLKQCRFDYEEKGIKKHLSYIENLDDKNYLSFGVCNINKQSFTSATYDRITDKIFIPKNKYQFYDDEELNKMKELIYYNKDLILIELLRGKYSKIYFDLDFDNIDCDINNLINSINFIVKIKKALNTEISGIVEFNNYEIYNKVKDILNSDKILYKYNDKKKKLLSSHLFILNYKIERTILSNLFKKFGGDFKTNGPFKKVLDNLVYKQNGKQQAIRLNIFAKPGKLNELAEYNEEELNLIYDNINWFLAHSYEDSDVLICGDNLKQIEKIFNEEVDNFYDDDNFVIVNVEKQKDKIKFKSIIKKEIKKNKTNNWDNWRHDSINKMIEIIKDEELEDNEDSASYLYDIFNDEEYYYESQSKGCKVKTQPSTLMWFIETAFKTINEENLKDKILLDISEIKMYKNKSIEMNEFMNLFKKCFIFFNNTDYENFILYKEKNEYKLKDIKFFINSSDSYNFDIYKIEEENGKMIKYNYNMNFKSILSRFENCKTYYENYSIYSINDNVFSIYNLDTKPKEEINELDENIYNILQLLCNKDDDKINYVLDWLAFLLQHPESRNQTALHFSGVQGTGKNLIFGIICDYLGKFGNNNGNIDFITGKNKFNMTLFDKKLYVCNECMNDTKELGKIKSFITESNLSLEEKNQPIFYTKNLINLVILSNHFETNTIEDNDRRFSFFYSSLKPYNEEFYANLFEKDENGTKIIKKEISYNFINFLLSRDIKNYNECKPYINDDKKILYERRLNTRSIIYRIIKNIFELNNLNSLKFNCLVEIFDEINKIKNDVLSEDDKKEEDDKMKVSIKDKTYEIDNDLIYDYYEYDKDEKITIKSINNILNYEKSDIFYIKKYVIYKKISNYDDLIPDEGISLKKLKENYKEINDKNYKKIFGDNFDILETKGEIRIKKKEFNIEIPDEGIPLKDIISEYDFINYKNYNLYLKNYRIERYRKNGVDCKYVFKQMN